MAEQKKIRVLVADDCEIVRCGLKAMLAGTEIVIIGEATTGPDTVKFALEHEVDVVLMDVRMPGGDGLNALGRIKLEKPEQPVLLFSSFDNPTYAARAVALGAAGYLLKDCPREKLIQAIETVAAGQDLWTRDELRRISGALATPRVAAGVEVSLTKREAEVLRHMVNGLTNEQIAEVMHISYETIKEHVQHILGRIGVTDRTQAAVWAVRNGLM
jgi:DNA-binding NarL/FixJ family response regulator